MDNTREKKLVVGGIGCVVGWLIGLFIGLIFGLVVLGWWLFPVQWVGGSLEHLNQDTQEEVLRMAIDAFALTGDTAAAQARYISLGEQREVLLADIYQHPAGQDLGIIASFSRAVGAEDALSATGPVPTSTEESASPLRWLRNLFLALCGVAILLFGAAALVILLRGRNGSREIPEDDQLIPDEVEPADEMALIEPADEAPPLEPTDEPESYDEMEDAPEVIYSEQNELGWVMIGEVDETDQQVELEVALADEEPEAASPEVEPPDGSLGTAAAIAAAMAVSEMEQAPDEDEPEIEALQEGELEVVEEPITALPEDEWGEAEQLEDVTEEIFREQDELGWVMPAEGEETYPPVEPDEAPAGVEAEDESPDLPLGTAAAMAAAMALSELGDAPTEDAPPSEAIQDDDLGLVMPSEAEEMYPQMKRKGTSTDDEQPEEAMDEAMTYATSMVRSEMIVPPIEYATAHKPDQEQELNDEEESVAALSEDEAGEAAEAPQDASDDWLPILDELAQDHDLEGTPPVEPTLDAEQGLKEVDLDDGADFLTWDDPVEEGDPPVDDSLAHEQVEESSPPEAEDDSLAKFSHPLTYIQGIGKTYAAKLKAAGVGTPILLLKEGSTPKGRKEIAAVTGISGKLILKWVNHIDLYRIRGVGHEYAELLETAGVDTVVELATRNPYNLHQKLGEVAQEKTSVRQAPGLSQVEDWVAQAKELPRAISY